MNVNLLIKADGGTTEKVLENVGVLKIEQHNNGTLIVSPAGKLGEYRDVRKVTVEGFEELKKWKSTESINLPILKGLHPSEKYGQEVLEMVSSLETSIQKASGRFSLKSLEEMSVIDFILHYASNGIRFVYEPTKEIE